MPESLPDYFTIATWPDGMKLVRALDPIVRGTLRGGPDWHVEEIRDGSMFHKIRDRAWRHLPVDGIIEELVKGADAHLALLNPNSDPVLLLNIDLTGTHEYAIEPHLATVDMALLTRAERNATVWILNEILRRPMGQVNDIAMLNIPESHGPPGRLHELLVESEALLLASHQMSPLDRIGAWSQLTSRVLSAIGKKGKEIVKVDKHWPDLEIPREIRWLFEIGGIDFFVVLKIPAIADVEKGDSGPTWSIHDAYWARPGQAAKMMPRARGMKYAHVATSSEGIAGVLYEAGIVVKSDVYPQWVETFSRPGMFSPDLEAYRLLGAPLPVLGTQWSFVAWVEGTLQ